MAMKQGDHVLTNAGELAQVFRDSPALPAFVTDLALALVGFRDRTVYRASNGQSQLFAHLTDVDITADAATGISPIRIAVHTAGLLTVLPYYVSEWAKEAEGSQETNYSLNDFVNVFDHRYILNSLRVRQHCLLLSGEEMVATDLELAALTMVGLKPADWTAAERVIWMTIVPQLIVRAGTLDALCIALEHLVMRQFDHSTISVTLDDLILENLPDKAIARCGQDAQLGGGSYLGQHIFSQYRCAHIKVVVSESSAYWTFVDAEDVNTTTWGTDSAVECDLGRARALTEQILKALLPLPLVSRISATLKPEAMCSTLWPGEPPRGAILGHSACID